MSFYGTKLTDVSLMSAMSEMRKLPIVIIAKWLTPEGKDWLVSKLSVEKTCGHISSFKDVFQSLNMMLMGVIHLGFAVGSYGIAIWLTHILTGHGLSSFHIGLKSMIPYGVAIVGMIAWAKSPNHPLHVTACWVR